VDSRCAVTHELRIAAGDIEARIDATVRCATSRRAKITLSSGMSATVSTLPIRTGRHSFSGSGPDDA
jgi:hypothetical protein